MPRPKNSSNPDSGFTVLTPELARLRRPGTLLFAVGNVSSGDDGAGPALLRQLRGKTALRLLDGGDMPENVAHRALEPKPDAILLVDAADSGQEPGFCALISPEEIGGQTVSSHGLSLSALVKFLKLSLPSCEIALLCIQVQDMRPGRSGLSVPVARSVRRLAKLLSYEKQQGI